MKMKKKLLLAEVLFIEACLRALQKDGVIADIIEVLMEELVSPTLDLDISEQKQKLILEKITNLLLFLRTEKFGEK